MRLLTLLLCLVAFTVSGQNIEFDFGAYGNAYFMTDLRNLQSDLNPALNGSEKVESFPPFLAFDLSARFKVKDEMVGPWVMYQSTGARNYYEDITGYFATDMILQGFSGGISVTKNVINERIFLTGNMGVVYNDLLIRQEIGVFSERDDAEGKYWSLNAAFLFGMEYRLLNSNPRVSIVGQVDGSYFGTNLKLKSDESTAPGEPEKVKVDWSGFKLGIRVGLTKQKSSDH